MTAGATRHDWRSIVDILRWRAEHEGERRAYGEWGEGDVRAWMTWAELDERARAGAVQIAREIPPGGRALLLHPPGFEYIAAFYACLYANVIAVPAYPPEPTRLERTLPRLQAIIDDAQANVVLTTPEIAKLAPAVSALAPKLASLRWIATGAVEPGAANEWSPSVARARPIDGETIAFLQYTSGSTGHPKGVVLTHQNLLHNSAAIQRGLGTTPDGIYVSWLPPYHDMGLIGCILHALWVGFPLVAMAPMAFLMRPFRWLDALSKLRAQVTGAPNFALDLCVQKIGPAERERLDLSACRCLYVSAEPVRRETLDRFAATFAPCGFQRAALYPTYGLAEATLIVTGGAPGSGVVTERLDDREVVGVGRTVTEGGEVLVVDPARRVALADGEVGEIWTRSASVARGYWNRPEESEATFGAHLEDGRGPYLRTGDLGFFRDGELYVTGRLKEVIIVRGRKHFPSDIEETIEATIWNQPHYRPGGSAAFALVHDGEERLGVVVEVERRRRERRASAPPRVEERRRGSDRRARPFSYRPDVPPTPLDPEAVVRAVRRAVAVSHGIEAWVVVLARPGAVPKTSSGKKRRLACRELAEVAGHRDVLYVWRADGGAVSTAHG
jgi:acyl-CoA synthetase (AMP-forming)/AMP-acid ligase II